MSELNLNDVIVVHSTKSIKRKLNAYEKKHMEVCNRLEKILQSEEVTVFHDYGVGVVGTHLGCGAIMDNQLTEKDICPRCNKKINHLNLKIHLARICYIARNEIFTEFGKDILPVTTFYYKNNDLIRKLIKEDLK